MLTESPGRQPERRIPLERRPGLQCSAPMPIERVAGAGDPRIALYRGLSDRELLAAHGLFIAEGRLVVQRAIEHCRPRVRSVLLNDAAYRQLEGVLRSLDPQIPIYIASTREFASLTGFNIHRGCLALVERPPAIAAGDLLRSLPRAETGRAAAVWFPRAVVVLERVANPDNVGGIFRNAAAFGAAAVLLDPGSCDPLYRKAVRTSMGAVLRVPFARVGDWPAGLEELRRAGFRIAALSPRRPALTIDELAAARPSAIALLAGAEGEGLSPAAAEMADWRVRIPIDPGVDSLNVAVAVGIALHRIMRAPVDPAAGRE